MAVYWRLIYYQIIDHRFHQNMVTSYLYIYIYPLYIYIYIYIYIYTPIYVYIYTHCIPHDIPIYVPMFATCFLSFSSHPPSAPIPWLRLAAFDEVPATPEPTKPGGPTRKWPWLMVKTS